MQFYSWSPVQFVLYFSNLLVTIACKISSFRDVFPYQFVGILNASFLPRGVCVRKINGYIFLSFHMQALRNHLMCGKLRSVIRSNGLDRLPVGHQQPCNGLGDRNGLPSMRQFLHQQHIRTAFHQGQDAEHSSPFGSEHRQVLLRAAIC